MEEGAQESKQGSLTVGLVIGRSVLMMSHQKPGVGIRKVVGGARRN